MSMLLRALLAWIVLTGIAQAHDVYTTYRNKQNVPCCGGSGPNADCSPITTPDHVQEGRYVTKFYSTIFNKWVIVPNSEITYLDMPGDVEKGNLGHICAKPRDKFAYELAPTEDNPDPEMYRYCAFLRPRSF